MPSSPRSPQRCWAQPGTSPTPSTPPSRPPSPPCSCSAVATNPCQIKPSSSGWFISPGMLIPDLKSQMSDEEEFFWDRAMMGSQGTCCCASSQPPSTVIAGWKRRAQGSADGSPFPPRWSCGCLPLLFASSRTFNMCGQTQALECNSVQGKGVGARSAWERRNG